MADLTIITTKQNQVGRKGGAYMYDPFTQGYGHGHRTFERGVQHTNVGGYKSLYYYADHESTFRTCMQILKMYHFREGLEFTNQIKYEEVVDQLHKFFDSCNGNRQTFLEVLFELEDDLNVADELYLCLNRNYLLDRSTGEILYSYVKELYRGNPIYYRLVSNDNTRLGGVYGRCLVCEAVRFENIDSYQNIRNHKLRYKREVSQNVVFYLTDCEYDFTRDYFKCPICKCRLYDVVAVVTKEEDTNDPIYFHIEKEVIHASKYAPSKMYGTSPITTLWNQMDTKMKFTQYLQSFLDYNRAPQGAIFLNTGNAGQVEQTLNQAEMKFNEDRYYLPIFAIDSQSNGTIAQYVRLTPFPEELKQLEIESALRREISALLGVQNVMLNDLEGVGGLNSESLQVQVTDRAALAGQIVYNTKVFPRLMELLGEYGQYEIGDDLSLIVKRTDNAENEIRMVNLERSINLALSIKDLGYEVRPDFTNLLGYDNKKLLPFSFREMSKEEIREEIELGLIEGGDKVTSPSQPARSKIPAFRTKQLVNRDDEPFSAISVKRNKEALLLYKVRFDDYEYGYVTEGDWENITKLRKDRRVRVTKERAMEDVKETVKKIYNEGSLLTKTVLGISSYLHKEQGIQFGSIYELVEKGVEVYVDTQNRIEGNRGMLLKERSGI